MSSTRGIRNCNPGNLRLSKDKWKGLREEQTDKDFFQFTEMKWGYRALFITLRNYRKKWDCWTIRDFISRWAPPTENNTEAYIKTVCNQMGVPDMWCPDVNDEDTMIAFAKAISFVENGKKAVDKEVEEGWRLI